MMSCSHIKEGPTWKTILASGDGAVVIQSARINKSFTKGTPVKTVIGEIAKQLDLPCNNVLKQLKGLMEKLPRGFSVSGNAMDELNRMLGQRGYNVSVQNNVLQVAERGEALAKRAISLTANSGLKGTPQLGSDNTMQVQAVLMPELLPGVKVHIESSVFSNFSIIQSLRIEGANFGEEWHTIFLSL